MTKVLVSARRGRSLWRYRKKFERFGLRYSREDQVYSGKIDDDRIVNKLVRYCIWHNLKFEVNDMYGRRSTDYRRKFFEANRPAIGNMYFCAYCGRLVSRKKITVDHLYPVAKVSSSPSLQRKMKAAGISSVNDVKNLVPACRKCNSKKSAKMGFWIIRGRIGKHKKVWIFRWSIRFGLLAVLIWFLLKMPDPGLVHTAGMGLYRMLKMLKYME